MRKNIDLIIQYIKLNLQTELTYRSNLIFTFISAMTYVFVFVLSLKFVFNYVPQIGGYNYDQLYVILMLSQLWWYANVLVARKNFQYIAKAINNGTLDYHLLKPYSFRILTPFLKFDFRHLMPIIITVFLLFIKLDFSSIGILQWLGAILFFMNGVLVAYSITSIFTSFSFWVGRNNSIFDISLEMPDLVRIPIEFFPFIVKGFFIFFVPVIIMVNPTFQILYNNMDYILLAEALIISLVLFFISEFTWKYGLKNYTSAN